MLQAGHAKEVIAKGGRCGREKVMIIYGLPLRGEAFPPRRQRSRVLESHGRMNRKIGGKVVVG